jgi:ketosteroid isomerase-like protein
MNDSVVRRLWERMEARDWPGVAACLAEDLAIDWPHSGERIRGRDSYVEIMRNYPEGWSARVDRVIDSGDEVAAEIRVEHDGGVFHAPSFYQVRDGVIVGGTEYWIRAGWFDPPEWRAQWVERPAKE